MRWGMVSLCLVLSALAVAWRASMTRNPLPEEARSDGGDLRATSGRFHPLAARSTRKATPRRGVRPAKAPDAGPKVGWVVSGRVGRPVDEESSAPVGGVLVRLSRIDGEPGTASEPPAAETRTASDGSFKFAGLEGESWWRIEVDEPASALIVRSFDLSEAEESSRKEFEGWLLLSPPADLRVRVVGPSGEPIEGASVVVDEDEEAERHSTRAGGGDYSFDRAATGSHSVTVTAVGYQEGFDGEVELPRDSPLLIELEIGLRIAGTVFSIDGTPIEGAKLRTWNHEATTDGAGNFLFDSLGPESLTVEITAAGFISEQHTVNQGMEDYEFWLVQEAVFSGRVVSEDDGSPVPKAKILLESSFGCYSDYTGADGRFRMEGVLPGTYEGSVDHRDHVPLKLGEMNLKQRESLVGQVIRIEKGSPPPEVVLEDPPDTKSETVTVIIVSPEGAALPDSSVSVHQFSSDGEGIRTAQVDSDGRFTFEWPSDLSRIQIRAAHRGFATRIMAFESASTVRGFPVVEIRLGHGGTIEGTVVNEEGMGIPGVEVAVALRVFDDPGLKPGIEESHPRRVRTRDDGTFECWHLSPGAYRVAAGADSRFPPAARFVKVLDGQVTQGVDFVFETGETLSGRVVDSTGAGVEGASVWVSTETGSAEAKTGAAGWFEMLGLKPGKVDVGAHFDGVSSTVLRTWIPSDAVVLTLQPRASIRGRVVSAGQMVFAGGAVEVSSWSEGWWESACSAGPDTVNLDHSGRFRTLVKPGRALLEISVPGFARMGLEIHLAPGEKREVVIPIENGATIQGRVVLRDTGEPLKWADILPRTPAGLPAGSFSFATYSDDDGGFTLEGAPAGPIYLIVRHPRCSLAKTVLLDVRAGQTTEASIELTAGQGVRGVFRSDGKPISGARVTAVSSSGGLHKEAVSSPDGFYEISGLPAGEYEFAVEGRGLGGEILERLVDATVSDGEFAELEIDFPAELIDTR